jgi:hypothetical protein
MDLVVNTICNQKPPPTVDRATASDPQPLG